MNVQGELFPTPAAPAPAKTKPAKTKMTGKSVCICGHFRADHHIGSPQQHDGGWYCLLEHCAFTRFQNGILTVCQCPGFQLTAGALLKRKMPSADTWDRCLSCTHIRGNHCTAHRPRKSKPAKPRPCENCEFLRPERYWGKDCPKCQHWSKQEWKAKLAAQLKAERTEPVWFGFSFEGQPYCCQHVDPANPGGDVRCDSSACAWSSDGENFCSCQEYKSPWVRPKAPPKPRQKKAISPAQIGLFPTPETKEK